MRSERNARRGRRWASSRAVRAPTDARSALILSSTPLDARPKVLRSKLFWVGVLYLDQGFPFGIFYDVLPVYFRQLGVDLREIGILALLGFAWTVKFLWAPAVDHYRRHRRWICAVNLAMGGCLIYLSAQVGFGPPTWAAIALFALLSATNDIAIDGYTIELLSQQELGLANGVRIGMARVGILAAGTVLILSDLLTWPGAYSVAAAAVAGLGVVALFAPRELTLAAVPKPWFLLRLVGAIVAFGLALGASYAVVHTVAALLTTGALPDKWSLQPSSVILTVLLLAVGGSLLLHSGRVARKRETMAALDTVPLFDALAEMLRRPYVLPVLLFVLLFKLGDASMGFMVKPFWVDAGFSATQIGLVSVNVGLALSILGGLAGGWFTDRFGIYKALWVLGLFQALSNLGYVWAAWAIPPASAGGITFEHKAIMYAASACESFTGGLGTAAFLAFLMAIVNKRHAATEYAILSSIFALSRQLAGYASGFGAEALGYAPYFLLTFFLSFPAYLLLPWAAKMLGWTEANAAANGAMPRVP
jgi:MFS transporter, PAT family, beta-lactamase induction signal transducer AmpG